MQNCHCIYANVIAVSEGANKNLGEACATTDTCVGTDPEPVCDATAETCRKLMEQFAYTYNKNSSDKMHLHHSHPTGAKVVCLE